MTVQLSPADRARLADRRRVAEMFRKRKYPTVSFDTDLVIILDDLMKCIICRRKSLAR